MSGEETVMAVQLKRHVKKLAVEIGDRSLERPEALEAAAQYIAQCFNDVGYEHLDIQGFDIASAKAKGKNIIAELLGTEQPEIIFTLGAHYDTVPGTPGADDNATGVAALLQLAKALFHKPLPFTVRFVAFAREETRIKHEMGSYAYAKRCAERGEKHMGMIALEMLGAYYDEPGSQRYPFPFSLFYPRQANFIAFVGNKASRQLLTKCIGLFRSLNSFPSEGCVAPDWVPDAGRSDHGSFWTFGIPAFMITDTAEFRFSLYHTNQDSLDKIDFERFARVVYGLVRMIRGLARSSS